MKICTDCLPEVRRFVELIRLASTIISHNCPVTHGQSAEDMDATTSFQIKVTNFLKEWNKDYDTDYGY